MIQNCPWCQEPLSWRERKLASCPHCERSLCGDTGHELRPIDVRYEEVKAAQQKRYQQLLAVGSVVVGAVSLLMPLLHLGVAVVVPLLLVAHLIAVRWVLIRDATRLLGTRRRLFSRWICRLSFVWVGMPGYGLAAIPVAGVVAGVATFAGLTALAHYYTSWSLDRERQRCPLALWEKLVLLGLVLLTVALVIVFGCVTLLLGFSIAKLLELFSAGG